MIILLVVVAAVHIACTSITPPLEPAFKLINFESMVFQDSFLRKAWLPAADSDGLGNHHDDGPDSEGLEPDSSSRAGWLLLVLSL